MLAVGCDAVGLVNQQMLSPTRAIIDGRETILAGTNNYMGITFDPTASRPGQQALDAFGTGTTGSRIANGTYRAPYRARTRVRRLPRPQALHRLHHRIPGQPGMMSGLAGPRDTIFLDADSHSSIYDGCTLSGAKLVRFRHNDAADLDKRLRARRAGQEGGGKLVVLEGIYSMLGDRAAACRFRRSEAKHGFELLVDEAHSFGVLGPNGRGLADEAGLEDEVRFRRRHVLEECRRHRRLRGGQSSLFDVSALCDAALHVHRLFLAGDRSPHRRAAIRKLAAEPQRRTRLMGEFGKRLFEGFKALGLDLGCDEVSPSSR
jgi:8-amino-7-oxononanoate synthase